MDKSAVSILQEYCQRSKFGIPLYDFKYDQKHNKFTFLVKVKQIDITASATDKREAKQRAAMLMLQKLKNMDPQDNDDSSSNESDNLSNRKGTDFVEMLKYYCLARSHLPPKISVLEEEVVEGEVVFTSLCRMQGERKYGIAKTVEGSFQDAARQMLRDLVKADNSHLPPEDFDLVKLLKTIEEETKNKFKNLRREMYGHEGCSGLPVKNRHNFFKNYDPEKRAQAFRVLKTQYKNVKDKVDDLMRALGLLYRINNDQSSADNNDEDDEGGAAAQPTSMVFAEVTNCEFDCCWINAPDKIHQDILNFFEIMLK